MFNTAAQPKSHSVGDESLVGQVGVVLVPSSPSNVGKVLLKRGVGGKRDIAVFSDQRIGMGNMVKVVQYKDGVAKVDINE